MAFSRSNSFHQSLLACAVAAGLALSAGGAIAQTPSNDRTAAPDTKRAEKDARKGWEQTHRASKIIGTEVRNPQDKKVGRVKDLVLSDPSSGTISHAVVAVGGVAGVGDKLFAVPFSQLQPAPGKDYLVLSGTSDLSKAFDENSWPADTAWQKESATPTSRSAAAPSTESNPAVTRSTTVETTTTTAPAENAAARESTPPQ